MSGTSESGGAGRLIGLRPAPSVQSRESATRSTSGITGRSRCQARTSALHAVWAGAIVKEALPPVDVRRIAAPKVSMPALKKLIALAVAGVVVSATVLQAADRKAAVEQVSFGIDAAKAGLWREATYRWERAVELDPTYAAAFNNLAIAYEQAGQFDKAKAAYQKAAELDPKNTYIRQNIDLFKEINDRANRQNSR